VAVLLKEDPQKVLPTLVLQKMPFVMQVLFFGALLSAIKSTASATLLAPERHLHREHLAPVPRPRMHRPREPADHAHHVLLFSAAVLAYAIRMQGTPIYELVSGAYQVPLVGAFVPLVCGLYWRRATTQGAVASILLGIGSGCCSWRSPGAPCSRPSWRACWPRSWAWWPARCCRSGCETHTPHRPLATEPA
jgi:SSS family solute:Na+ symporter